jgi:hypothetical protein
LRGERSSAYPITDHTQYGTRNYASGKQAIEQAAPAFKDPLGAIDFHLILMYRFLI